MNRRTSTAKETVIRTVRPADTAAWVKLRTALCAGCSRRSSARDCAILCRDARRAERSLHRRESRRQTDRDSGAFNSRGRPGTRRKTRRICGRTLCYSGTPTPRNRARATAHVAELGEGEPMRCVRERPRGADRNPKAIRRSHSTAAPIEQLIWPSFFCEATNGNGLIATSNWPRTVGENKCPPKVSQGRALAAEGVGRKYDYVRSNECCRTADCRSTDTWSCSCLPVSDEAATAA